MYVNLTDTIHENTYKMEELLHDKKRKQNIYKKAVAEALSLGTGGSAGTPCNLLFWWLPSHCHISDFLFQMSWVTRNQNKAYLISYTVFSLVNLDLIKDPSFFFFRSFNGDSQPMLLGMGPCQLPRGHWQVTVLQLSGLISPVLGTSGCFQPTAPLPPGFTSALAGFHPTVCPVGREQTQAATSEILLYIQVTDYTWPRQTEAKQR